MASPFDRIVRADRPIVTALLLVGVGFALSMLVGLFFGWLADDFQSALGRTIEVGMLVTSVAIIALLAIATQRQRQRE